MIRKSAKRFSEKIMLKDNLKRDANSSSFHRALDLEKVVSSRPTGGPVLSRSAFL
jgi:hypothetical protein